MKDGIRNIGLPPLGPMVDFDIDSLQVRFQHWCSFTMQMNIVLLICYILKKLVACLSED